MLYSEIIIKNISNKDYYFKVIIKLKGLINKYLNICN